MSSHFGARPCWDLATIRAEPCTYHGPRLEANADRVVRDVGIRRQTRNHPGCNILRQTAHGHAESLGAQLIAYMLKKRWPHEKKPKNALLWKNKKKLKALNKKRYSNQMRKFSSKMTLYTVLLSNSVHDNVWEIWLFIREFPIAAMLNSLLKNPFI